VFVELVQGTAVDEAALRRAWDRTLATIADEAEGWLGATSGVAPGADFLALLGFDSEEAARITMGKLHLRATWDELRPLVANLRFRELPHVRAFGVAEVVDADVVEVTHGPANDIGRVVSVFEGAGQEVRAAQAPVLGGLLAWDDSAYAVSARYRRSSEAAAAASRDPLRDDAPMLLEQAAELELSGPWSILAPPGLPAG
jgi:hypothetical protein